MSRAFPLSPKPAPTPLARASHSNRPCAIASSISAARARKLTGRLEDWQELDFAAFRDEVKRAFHAEIPVKQRGEWEVYLTDNAAELNRLSVDIAAAERDIDALVYSLFDLTATNRAARSLARRAVLAGL